MINKSQQFWDKNAKRYDSGEKRFDQVTKELIIKTRKYLDVNDNVLDFGCATGTKTLEFADGVKHIYGLDISIEMIKKAIEKKDEANIMNVSFSQGTIFDNDFEETSFDKIIAYSIIHLLEDSEKVIRRIHELLKSGGLFISTTACFKDRMGLMTGLEFRVSLLLKRLGFLPLHLNMFLTGDVEKLITNQDFQIVEAEKIFHEMTISFIIARKP